MQMWKKTQTYEIIEDVAKLKSEIGILYTSSQNETIIMKLIRRVSWTRYFQNLPKVRHNSSRRTVESVNSQK